ncbi:hypothetical protein EA58_06485 [Photobacterium galatheae]|uniref:Uncharacterized protein n=1 Tax=Photobacterium galatheae TaxID=1654360 RepID=A0A066RTC1_9GAMM|nr:hypothetical protein EA58_06485 [Photobacterium galatheae]
MTTKSACRNSLKKCTSTIHKARQFKKEITFKIKIKTNIKQSLISKLPLKNITRRRALIFVTVTIEFTRKCVPEDRKRMQKAQPVYTSVHQQSLNYRKPSKMRHHQKPNDKNKKPEKQHFKKTSENIK